MMLSDLAISSLRMRVGLGIDPRAELRGFAWVYLVDLCLAPVGLFAALVGARDPVALVAVLPLAALLAVFARERRGRIENALSAAAPGAGGPRPAAVDRPELLRPDR